MNAAAFNRALSPLILVVAAASIDLATKVWARASLEPYAPAVDFLPFVSLRLSFNDGVSFSMFTTESDFGRVILISVTAALTLVMAVLAYRSQGWQRMALSAIVGGALANLVDRIAHGSVTDFLGLHFGDWYPFVFNLADLWISVGAGLLLAARLLPSNQVQPRLDTESR